MKVYGKAVKYGDNVDTDVILPGKYLVLTDPNELAQHALEGLDSEFTERARNGVIVVAGKNFGCGSSREQAPIALKYAGTRCIIAESFARIFFRNAINIGLPVIECSGISAAVSTGETLEVSLADGEVRNLTKNQVYHGTKLPPFIMKIMEDGGLIENLRRKLKGERV
jgi:3-isopropylmalate/(R)-2-methylmalate dehydratase small subunit